MLKLLTLTLLVTTLNQSVLAEMQNIEKEPLLVKTKWLNYDKLQLKLQASNQAKISLESGFLIEALDKSEIIWSPVLPHKFKFGKGYLMSEKVILEAKLPDNPYNTGLRITYGYCPSEDMCKYQSVDLLIPPKQEI